ncbi:MAG: hypothetical protein M1357_01730 [Candidatus Marsarchaeota archaeon]|nr:hypothetical protein [Candidatus Marsarchaeota archaeon]
MSLTKILLKRRRGSPLLEEGLLVGLALVLFAVLVSSIMGVFGYLQGAAHPLSSLGSGLSTLFNNVLQGYTRIFKYLTGQ